MDFVVENLLPKECKNMNLYAKVVVQEEELNKLLLPKNHLDQVDRLNPPKNHLDLLKNNPLDLKLSCVIFVEENSEQKVYQFIWKPVRKNSQMNKWKSLKVKENPYPKNLQDCNNYYLSQILLIKILKNIIIWHLINIILIC